jgi:hypothetical protein
MPAGSHLGSGFDDMTNIDIIRCCTTCHGSTRARLGGPPARSRPECVALPSMRARRRTTRPPTQGRGGAQAVRGRQRVPGGSQGWWGASCALAVLWALQPAVLMGHPPDRTQRQPPPTAGATAPPHTPLQPRRRRPPHLQSTPPAAACSSRRLRSSRSRTARCAARAAMATASSEASSSPTWNNSYARRTPLKP